MAVIPFTNWSSLRLSLAKYLSLNDPPLDRLEVRIRFMTGKEETINTIPVAGQNFTGETLLGKIVTDVEEHTKFFEPIGRITLRVFPMARNGSRMATAGSDVFSINTDGGTSETGAPDALAPLGAPAADILAGKLLGDVPPRGVEALLGQLLHFSHLQNYQLTNNVVGVFQGQLNDMQGTIREITATLERANGKAMDSMLAQRQAQQDADVSRKETALAQADNTLKHELMKQFGGNVNSLLSLLMTKVMGIPPNDPQLLKSYLAGLAKQNPEAARELLGMAMQSGSFDPQAMQQPLLEWAKANPEAALEFGSHMVAEIEKHNAAQLAAQAAAGKK